jgi:hypothetical protein
MNEQECLTGERMKATTIRRRRASVAAPSPPPRRRAWGRVLVLALLLVSRADWVAAQNPLPAAPAASSSTEQITDQVLFEGLKDSSERLYLPRYKLAVQTVSGDQQYRVRFARQGTGWNLEVYLEKYPAPELGDAARTAKELPHQTKLLLRYNLLTGAQGGQGSAYRELVFQEATLERSGLKAVLHLDDLRERDALVHALEDPKFDAKLLVQRTFTVLSHPLKEIGEVNARIDGVKIDYKYVIDWDRECDPVLKKYEKVVAGKESMSSLPKDEQMALGWCMYGKQLDSSRVELRRKLTPLEEELARLKKQKGPVTVTLDDSQPFYFERTHHPYVFAGVVPDPGAKPQLVRKQLAWQGRYYSYFRPADRDDLWYYIPDRFVLAEEKQTPRLSVKFTGPPEAQTVEVEYVAVPQTQPERLKAAEGELRPTAASKMTLEPLLVEEARLWVALPTRDGQGLLQQRPAASVNLRDGLRDQLRLTPEEFQQIYAALFSNSILLTGEVKLDLGGSMRELIPFEARVTGQSPAALWDKLMSQVVFADYQKTIRVKALGTVFGAEVKTLVVEFKEGETVELSRDQLEAPAKVRLPMRDFILNTEGSGQYHYKVTAIRERGGQSIKTEMLSWKTATVTILYPEVP